VPYTISITFVQYYWRQRMGTDRQTDTVCVYYATFYTLCAKLTYNGEVEHYISLK